MLTTVFTSLYQRMKKLSYTLSCIKQNVYTFLFYFLRLSCSYSSPSLYHLSGTQHQLTQPHVKSSTLPLRKMPVFQGVAPRHTIFTSYCIIPLWNSATAHSPSGKELNFPLRKMPVFKGVAPRHSFFTSSCVIPLRDSARAQTFLS